MTDKESVSKFESDDIPPAPNILPCGPGRNFWFLESSYKIHVLRSSNEAWYFSSFFADIFNRVTTESKTLESSKIFELPPKYLRNC